MAKATIRLHEVPPKFKEQAHDMEYVCQHLYSKVVDGEASPAHLSLAPRRTQPENRKAERKP